MSSQTSAPWQFRRLGRLEAEKMLVESQKDGAFLVRESESMKGAHVLSLGLQGKVHHYRVMPSEKGYYIQAVIGLQQKHFQTLEELVQFYKQSDNGLASCLNHPITATSQEEEEDTDEDDDNESGDEFKMVKFFQASLSGAKIDETNVDEAFASLLTKYVNDGIVRDVDAMQVERTKLPDQFLQLVQFAYQDMEQELTKFGRRMEAMKIFLDRCIGTKRHLSPRRRAAQKKNDSSLESLASRFADQATEIRSIESKALQMLAQTATMIYPITQNVPATREERPLSALLPQTIQTFEVQSIHAARVTKKGFLKVDVQSGQMFICKTQDDFQTPYNHMQILQLIKSRSNRAKLGVKLEGKGRRDFQFEDVKKRELFCQMVQQMRNVHSESREVDAISVFVGTWNMGDAEPPHPFSSWLKCSGSGKSLDPIIGSLPHDIYAFGTQESALNEKEWIQRLKSSLNVVVRINFKLVAAQTLWGIRLVILVREEHFNKISHVQVATVKTGIGGVAGNKGGIGISFFFNGTSLCFVNCHLTSGNERCHRRNNNFYDILRGLQIGQASRKMGGAFDLTHQCHHVFWFGDLNYRIDLPVQEIFDCVEKKEYGRLMECDQLKVEQKDGRVFANFDEEEINFAPTYRYKRGTRLEYEYQKFKKTGVRINVPSFCDRVLLSSFPGTQVNNMAYGCTDDIMTSDHSPVYAAYQVGITSQFISDSASSAMEKRNQSDCQIRVTSISAAVCTSSNTSFYLEIYSGCLEGVFRSKKNTLFTSASTWVGLPTGGQEKAHYTYPEWTAAAFEQAIHPIMSDRGYLEQQYLHIAVKSVEDDESYGECVVSLRSVITPVPSMFQSPLTHRGMATGLLHGTIHLPWNKDDTKSPRPASAYEMITSFISNDDEDDSQLGLPIGRERSVVSSPQRWRSVRQKKSSSELNSSNFVYAHSVDVETSNGHLRSNGVGSDERRHEQSLTSQSTRSYDTGPRRKAHTQGTNDEGLDDMSIQLTFRKEYQPKPNIRSRPPLFPREDDDSRAAAALPQKKPSSLIPPHAQINVSGPPSPSAARRRPPASTLGPQLGPEIASSAAQRASKGSMSSVKELAPKPGIAQRPRHKPESPETRRKNTVVAQWLQDAGLPGRYSSLLVQSGWDDPAFFSDMSAADLMGVGITSQEHQKKILQEASK